MPLPKITVDLLVDCISAGNSGNLLLFSSSSFTQNTIDSAIDCIPISISNKYLYLRIHQSVKYPAELVESLLPGYSGVIIELSRGNTTNELLI